MRRILHLLLALQLAGCAAHTVRLTEGAPPLQASPSAQVQVVKLNEFSQGFQCFEPMLFVLTAGIIPTHCVDTYRVSVQDASQAGSNAESTYTVTTMGGWVSLVLMPLPGWHFGTARQANTEVEKLVRSGGQ